MQRATIEVAFVNPPKTPGGKVGSVKDVNGTYYGVFANHLASFQKGGRYVVDYETSDYNGRPSHMIKAVLPSGDLPAGPVATPAAPAPAYGQRRGNGAAQAYRPTAPRDAERMFVCSILNASIQAGQVSVQDEDGMFNAVNRLRALWRDSFGHEDEPKGQMYGTNPERPGNADLNDALPF